MFFKNNEKPLTLAEIENCERALCLQFPSDLRLLYLHSNGGEPDPYVFSNEDLDTVVHEFLPLICAAGGDALTAYSRLVVGKKLTPPWFFPFAVDGGGDYFFCDTSTAEGRVYFFRSDSADGEALLSLGQGVRAFFDALIPE